MSVCPWDGMVTSAVVWALVWAACRWQVAGQHRWRWCQSVETPPESSTSLHKLQQPYKQVTTELHSGDTAPSLSWWVALYLYVLFIVLLNMGSQLSLAETQVWSDATTQCSNDAWRNAEKMSDKIVSISWMSWTRHQFSIKSVFGLLGWSSKINGWFLYPKAT